MGNIINKEEVGMENGKWINEVLQNDESSTDKELVNYFMENGPMTRSEATELVNQRGECLKDIHYEVRI